MRRGGSFSSFRNLKVLILRVTKGFIEGRGRGRDEDKDKNGRWIEGRAGYNWWIIGVESDRCDEVRGIKEIV